MTWPTRLQGRPDDEHTQALLRIALLAVILVYRLAIHDRRYNWSAPDLEIVQVLGGLLVLAIAILAAIWLRPQRNIPRRFVGMLADVGACTWFMWIAGDFAFFAIGVYFFIIFGNAFRYGRAYLFASQALCVAGMVSALMLVPFWKIHQVAGFALLILVVVKPLYVWALVQQYRRLAASSEDA